jgi:hypothetical protein
MNHAAKWIGWVAAGLALTVAALTGGCTGDLVANLTETKEGSIILIFINTTPYRASFACGSYDTLQRSPPGPIDFRQVQVERNVTSAEEEIVCRRNTALGTAALIQRATDTEQYTNEAFDPDIFSPVINFSAATRNTEGESLPTVGTAEGIEVRLGVDYACGDVLYFTFEEDPNAPGGFSVEFDLLRSEDNIP